MEELIRKPHDRGVFIRDNWNVHTELARQERAFEKERDFPSLVPIVIRIIGSIREDTLST